MSTVTNPMNQKYYFSKSKFELHLNSVIVFSMTNRFEPHWANNLNIYIQFDLDNKQN